MQSSSLGHVHEHLLLRLASLVFDPSNTATSQRERSLLIRKIAGFYQPTQAVWKCLFRLEATRTLSPTDGQVVNEIYEQWRRFDEKEATVTWAEWAFRNGRVLEAQNRIIEARCTIGSDEAADLERQWSLILDANRS